MKISDKVEDAIFNIHWYLTVGRPIRASMKRFNRNMDRAIETLNKAFEKYPEIESNVENEIKCEQKMKLKKRRFI